MKKMNNALLSSIIGGLLSGFFSVVMVIIQNNKTMALLEERDKTMKEEIIKLSNKVEAHNNFGLQLAKLETRVDLLEKRV